MKTKDQLLVEINKIGKEQKELLPKMKKELSINSPDKHGIERLRSLTNLWLEKQELIDIVCG